MAKKEAKTLDELFHDTLKDIYFAEKKILATLPKMEKAAQAEELKRAFSKHKTETEGQVIRLEKVFAAIDKKPQGKTCDAIVGIAKEGQEIMVKVINIDPTGKIRLSRKALLQEAGATAADSSEKAPS